MSVNLPIPPEVLDALADAVADRLADRLEPPQQWPEWMSVETASGYLDCSAGRLYKLVQRGAIPYSQETDGGRIFFERCELDAWMKTRKPPGQ